jgi:hypothetical protein
LAAELLHCLAGGATVGIGDLPSKSSSKTLIYCEEGRELLEAFGANVHELILLHEQQFLAVTNGDPECDRFDLLIHMANEAKQRAKYCYLEHLETHGCSKSDDIYKS